MKASHLTGLSVLIASLPGWAHPAAAQHHPTTHTATAPAMSPHATGSVHTGAATGQSSAAMQRQMQQMMQVEIKQQEHMMRMQQQMHEEHMKKFQQWAASNGMAGGSGTGGLPSSPAAMQNWLRTQKHNKALGKSVDPRYEQYVAFQKEHNPHAKAAEVRAEEKAESEVAAAAVAAHAMRRLEHLPHTTTAGLSVGPSVSMLRTVHRKLLSADYNYSGHLNSALNHINSALVHLGSSAIPNAVRTGSSSAAAQSVSNTIVQDALVKLQTVHNHLSGSGATTRHLSAQNAVTAAMQELNMALSFR